MLLNQIKIATLLALVGLGSGYCLWQASGAGVGDQEPGPAGLDPDRQEGRRPHPGRSSRRRRPPVGSRAR